MVRVEVLYDKTGDRRKVGRKATVMEEQIQAVGVGSPAVFYLHEFGRLVYKVFGEHPFLVGSALHGKNPRDIDVRVRVNRERFRALFDDLAECGGGSRYAVICMAFSALGERMTGLPVDFQVQHPGIFNQHLHKPRLELGKETVAGQMASVQAPDGSTGTARQIL